MKRGWFGNRGFAKNRIGVFINLIIIFLWVMLVIGLFSVIVSAAEEVKVKDYNNDGKIDDAEIAYFFGMNIDEFLKQNPGYQEKILGNKANIEKFMQGLSESKNEEKFLEMWVGKNEKKEAILRDETKNKLWQYFSSHEQSNDYLKKIANKLYQDLHKKPEKGIQEVILKNPEKLIWKGNKIGVLNDKGDLKLWIDLDKIPYWMKKINFDGEKFNCQFDTENTVKNIVFSGGTIGELGELIGPDGKVIGTRMNEGLQSIKYDDAKKQFVIKYEFMGKEQTLTLGESDLPPDIRKNILEVLNKPGMVGDKLREVLGDLNGVGIDFRKSTEGGVPSQNMLNVLYGENKGTTETIEIAYNDKNEPNIKIKDGGTLVTTDSKGKVERTYKQWASSSDDEEGVFLFKNNGEIEAAQNAVVDVSGFGKTYVSRAELIGVNIARNTFVDAIARGDKKAVLEAVFQKGSNIVDELQFSLSIKELRAAGYDAQGTNLPKVQEKLLNILKQELENPDLAIEYKNQIQEAIQKITNNLGEFGSNMLDYSLIRDRDINTLSADQRRVLEETKTLAAKEVEKAVTELLSNPEQLKNLAKYSQGGAYYGDKEAANQFLKDFLKTRTTDTISALGPDGTVDAMNKILQNKKVTDLIGQANKLPTSQELITQVNGIIDGIDFSGEMEKALKSGSSDWQSNWKSSVKNTLTERLKSQGISNADSNKVSDSIMSLVSEANDKITKESNDFQQRLKRDFTEESNKYANNIFIDTYLNKVDIKSNKVVIFDAQTPLTQFTATSTRKSGDMEESVIQLWSGGNKVAVFDGSEIRTERTANQANYVSISRVINGQTGSVLKLDTGYYGYNLYDPTQLVSKSNSMLSIGWRRAHPILHTTIQGPSEGDIAANPDSSVTMTIGSDNPSRLIKFALRKSGGFPVSQGGQAAKEALATAISQMKEAVGGEEQLNQIFSKGNSFFEDIKSTGANVPQIITDSYYVASHLDELNKLADFISTAPNLQARDKIILTGTYIEMSGRKLEMSPEIHRLLLRAVAANPINKHWSLRQGMSVKKRGPQESDFF